MSRHSRSKKMAKWWRNIIIHTSRERGAAAVTAHGGAGSDLALALRLASLASCGGLLSLRRLSARDRFRTYPGAQRNPGKRKARDGQSLVVRRFVARPGLTSAWSDNISAAESKR